jgi:hypothetical protein
MERGISLFIRQNGGVPSGLQCLCSLVSNWWRRLGLLDGGSRLLPRSLLNLPLLRMNGLGKHRRNGFWPIFRWTKCLKGSILEFTQRQVWLNRSRLQLSHNVWAILHYWVRKRHSPQNWKVSEHLWEAFYQWASLESNFPISNRSEPWAYLCYSWVSRLFEWVPMLGKRLQHDVLQWEWNRRS